MNKLNLLPLLLCLGIAFNACAQTRPSANAKANKHFNKAVEQYARYELDNAQKSLESALKEDPDFADAAIFMAEIYLERKEPETALKMYENMGQRNPNYDMFYFQWGTTAMNLYRYDLAATQLEKFLSFPDIKPEYKKLAEERLKRSRVASMLVKNPVPFEPKNMGPKFNSPYNEYFPGMTIDGSSFYFTREINRNEDFYVSRKNGDHWTMAANLGAPINTEQNEGTITVTADGRLIFFTACNREDGVGSCDIYAARLLGNTWSKPVCLSAPLNSKAWDSQPSIAIDNRTIYFSSARQGGYGGMDIYRSTMQSNGSWSEPENLGPNINTAGNEQFPFIAADDQTLFFASNAHPGMGGMDLFYSRKDSSGNFAAPINLGYPINTPEEEFSLFIASDGKNAYYSTNAIQDNSFGGLDLYTFILPEAARPISASYVRGVVFDNATKVKLQASVELVDLKTGKTIASTTSAADDGSFLVALPGGKDYALLVNRVAYLPHSENFSLAQTTESEPHQLSIGLNKPAAGAKLTLKNIFFDLDKSTLKPASTVELDRLVAYLKSNPGVKIQVNGHTDNQGNKAYNQTLSQNRAKTVTDYLISKGIAAERLKSKGFGDTQPIAPNTSEEGRAQNRRTEVEIW